MENIDSNNPPVLVDEPLTDAANGNAGQTASDGNPDVHPENNAEPAEQTEPAEPASNTGPSAPSPDLIAEAEQRGYLRGRNERIAELIMQRLDSEPAADSNATQSPSHSDDADTCPAFLANIRPGFWDL